MKLTTQKGPKLKRVIARVHNSYTYRLKVYVNSQASNHNYDYRFRQFKRPQSNADKRQKIRAKRAREKALEFGVRYGMKTPFTSMIGFKNGSMGGMPGTHILYGTYDHNLPDARVIAFLSNDSKVLESFKETFKGPIIWPTKDKSVIEELGESFRAEMEVRFKDPIVELGERRDKLWKSYHTFLGNYIPGERVIPELKSILAEAKQYLSITPPEDTANTRILNQMINGINYDLLNHRRYWEGNLLEAVIDEPIIMVDSHDEESKEQLKNAMDLRLRGQYDTPLRMKEGFAVSKTDSEKVKWSAEAIEMLGVLLKKLNNPPIDIEDPIPIKVIRGFNIYKTTYYPMNTEPDEELYDTIEAGSFEEAKEKVKQGVDIFNTKPTITEETEESIEFTIDRNRYSNCIFRMSNE